VPAERIGESLAFINWTVLTALGVGTFAAVVAGRFRTEATKGYLGFAALSAAAFALLAWLADGGLPVLPPGDITFSFLPFDPAWDAPRRSALLALAALALVYAIRLFGGHRSAWVAAGGLAAAATALVGGALSWGGGGVASLLLLIELSAISAVLGGVWASMVLGHWYLVTPKLPELALIRFSRWLTWALVAQLVLFAVWIGLGAGPSGTPAFAALFGPWALFVWLRLLVGLVFPLIVSWAATQTARTRSMESATGLLYINVGTIAAGTILAAGLYFGAGLLV
jgi:hypothetical protein